MNLVPFLSYVWFREELVLLNVSKSHMRFEDFHDENSKMSNRFTVAPCNFSFVCVVLKRSGGDSMFQTVYSVRLQETRNVEFPPVLFRTTHTKEKLLGATSNLLRSLLLQISSDEEHISRIHKISIRCGQPRCPQSGQLSL